MSEPSPRAPRSWGNWRLSGDGVGLFHDSTDYEVPLGQLVTTSDLAHWLAHLGEKRWCSFLDLEQLRAAFCDLRGASDPYPGWRGFVGAQLLAWARDERAAGDGEAADALHRAGRDMLAGA